MEPVCCQQPAPLREVLALPIERGRALSALETRCFDEVMLQQGQIRRDKT